MEKPEEVIDVTGMIRWLLLGLDYEQSQST
jgi:hypothetical protein